MQGFGENKELYKLFGLANGHNGIDVKTFKGDDCVAVHSGTIFKIERVTDIKTPEEKYNGNAVWLLTDEINGKVYLCPYGHLDSINVVKDQRVERGEVLGKEGNTGAVSSGNNIFWGNAPANMGVHCHFGVYELIEGDDGFQSFKSSGKLWHIANYNNGFRGAIDPLPLLVDQDPRIPLIEQLISLIDQLIAIEPKVALFQQKLTLLQLLLKLKYNL